MTLRASLEHTLFLVMVSSYLGNYPRVKASAACHFVMLTQRLYMNSIGNGIEFAGVNTHWKETKVVEYSIQLACEYRSDTRHLTNLAAATCAS